nr:reverse transcriptase domain-containing protein [Tanacetum cinerariifolium]
MLRACPHHGFIELAQIDTFYNGLNDNDQDSLNAATGGNLLSKTTREALQIIENKSKVRYSRNKPNVSRMNTTSRENASKSDDRIDKLADQIATLVDIFAKKVVTPALVKAVEESCVTCGGNHAYYNCPNSDSNQPSVCVVTGTYNQNQSSTSGTLPSNTILNPKGEMKAITTRSGVAYEGPSIPTPKKLSLPELTPTRMTLELADRTITRPKGIAEDVFVKVGKFHFPTDFVVVEFTADPRVPHILGRSFLRTDRALIDVYGEEITLRVNDEAVTFNLNQTTRYSSIYDDLSVNRIDIIDVAREEYAQKILGFSNNSSGGNPTLTFEAILFDSSPSITSFEGSDFILEEIDSYLKDEMPFGLCIAPGTFQRCMMAIFHDMIEKTMEVFMNDVLVFGDSFSSFLSHLDTMLQRNYLSSINKWSSEGVESRFEAYFLKDGWGKPCLLVKKLDDALWAFRTAYKTPIGCTPYKLVYKKSCHLPIELERKAYWALKHVNFDLKNTGDHQKLQLNEINELRDQAYKNSLIYKEKTKKIHDFKIKKRIFNVGDRVLLFNSHLKIFSGKFKTRWSGPFTITKVFPYGTVELSQSDGPKFKVSGHRETLLWRGRTTV